MTPDTPRGGQGTRLAMIDLANAEMCAAKRASFDAYERVHPVGHARCAEACRDAHRRLVDELAAINAAYQAALPRID